MSTPVLLPPPFRRPTVVRTAILWLFLRGVSTTSVVQLMEIPVEDALRPGLLNQLWMAGILAAAVWIDMGRRQETVFAANLGISLRHVAGFVAAQSFLMDLMLGWIVG